MRASSRRRPPLAPTTSTASAPGVLEDREANARLLLESMVDNLRAGADIGATTTGSKPVAGPASRSTMAMLTEECDFVVVGSSD